jgi:hypothetical protein
MTGQMDEMMFHVTTSFTICNYSPVLLQKPKNYTWVTCACSLTPPFENQVLGL